MSNTIPSKVIETLQRVGANEETIKLFKEEADKLFEQKVTGKSGGDMVVIRGCMEHGIQRVEVSDELLEMNDKDMISDMIVSALSDFSNKMERWTTESAAQFASKTMLSIMTNDD